MAQIGIKFCLIVIYYQKSANIQNFNWSRLKTHTGGTKLCTTNIQRSPNEGVVGFNMTLKSFFYPFFSIFFDLLYIFLHHFKHFYLFYSFLSFLIFFYGLFSLFFFHRGSSFFLLRPFIQLLSFFLIPF